MTDRLVCACCGAPITPATRSPGHVYRLGVYELLSAERLALRIGWRWAAVCAPCVCRIHAAAAARHAKRAVMASGMASIVSPQIRACGAPEGQNQTGRK